MSQFEGFKFSMYPELLTWLSSKGASGRIKGLGKITTNRLAKEAVYFYTSTFKPVAVGTLYCPLWKTLKITFLGSGGGHAHVVVHMWQSEDNSQESAPLLYHVGYGDQIQVIRLGGKRLYLLNCIKICPLEFPPRIKPSIKRGSSFRQRMFIGRGNNPSSRVQ